jgi:hypothetical protein
MAIDDEWVADVRRWCQRGAIEGKAGAAPRSDEFDSALLGYEAAVPSLQARHWPDATVNTKGEGSA